MANTFQMTLLLLALAGSSYAQIPSTPSGLGFDMLCGSCIAPKDIPSRTIIAPAGEPGERIVISGRILQADGISPAAGITLWLFHADARGHLNANDDEGNPRLHGWVRSDSSGNYEFSTIRPAPDSDLVGPAHIHVHLFGPGFPERFIPEFRFHGDRLLSADERNLARLGRRSPVVVLKRDAQGPWRGTRDIRLEQSQADLVKRLLDVLRLEALRPGEIAATLGCKLGAVEKIHEHRAEYALTDCGAITEGRVLTGGTTWVAVTFKPADWMELTLTSLVASLLDYPFALDDISGQTADGSRRILMFTYLFRVPAGMVSVGVKAEATEGERPDHELVRLITVTNEPRRGLEKAKSLRAMREDAKTWK